MGSLPNLESPLQTSRISTVVPATPRVRVSESGRAFIKCNDAGVRIVESHCDKTVGEWLDENEYSLDGLVHDHVLGPDLA
ncbi:omega-hydroxypalmitate O-feruloyl transferase-like protein, partial [Trifolium pratense]